MTKLPEPSRLSSLQLELLKIYTYNPSDDELLEIKDLLAQYFSNKLENNMANWAIKNNITDEDLDKWLEDDAVAGNAGFIVSHDNHYNILKTIPFPKVNVIKIPEFKEILDRFHKRIGLLFFVLFYANY